MRVAVIRLRELAEFSGTKARELGKTAPKDDAGMYLRDAAYLASLVDGGGEGTVAECPRRLDVTRAGLVGGVEKRKLAMAGYDPQWPERYRFEEQGILAVLNDASVRIHHIGSTSAPCLAAKAIIDVLVIVLDITAEEHYLPQLLGDGYVLRVREPGRRLVRTPELDVQVHIMEAGNPAAEAYLLLRGMLRNNPVDCRLYEEAKRVLVRQDWCGHERLLRREKISHCRHPAPGRNGEAGGRNPPVN